MKNKFSFFVSNSSSALLFSVLCAMFIASCTQSTKKDTDGLENIVPTAEKDSGPRGEYEISELAEIVPRYEERTAAGNKSPYKVLGKVYRVMDDPRGYKETGIASWYGTKFHGENTSNGERYDMYAISGAHKTLPIPAYVKVTNIGNNRSLIVRINDRGPFKAGRIIDLSYAAAVKLDYARAGTATVEVEYIDVIPAAQVTNPANDNQPTVPRLYLQLGAFTSAESARQHSLKIGGIIDYPVTVSSGSNSQGAKIFRVFAGPIEDETALLELQRELKSKGLEKSMRVVR